MTTDTIYTAEEKTTQDRSRLRASRLTWIIDLLLIFVLLAGAYFRVVGLYWGEYQYLHPDERFLVMVGSSISPVKCLDTSRPVSDCPEDQKDWISLAEYFDTANSTLNPANRGYGFYVYGTLPMFLTRYVAEWIFNYVDLREMTQVGRALSALADLLTVFLVFLVAERLYNKRVALLAAAFSTAAVLQIQQSHFFTMDTFINFFTFLAFFFAVLILVDRRDWSVTRKGSFFSNPLFLHSIGFGIAFGMAVASKINAAPMALALPAAVAIRMGTLSPREREDRLIQAIGYLVLAGALSFIVFRFLQPYAFTGPGFFGIHLNEQWMASLRELRNQNTVEVDFPPAMQWARRPVWFSAQNLTVWGLGLPLGVLAWAGFLWAGWRILKGDWERHALIWGWTALYFTWQSSALNPTMRYQLPIYPMLTIFAAWAVVALYDLGKRRRTDRGGMEDGRTASGFSISSSAPIRGFRWLAVGIGGVVLIATLAWAFAFTRIYTRPVTRIEASRWIYQNVSGPLNLHIQDGDTYYNQPLPFPYGFFISPGVPFHTSFRPNASGTLSEVFVPHVVDNARETGQKTLILTISALPNGEQPLATGKLTSVLVPGSDPRGEAQTFTLSPSVSLLEGQTYYLKLELQGEQQPVAIDSQVSLTLQTGGPDDRIQPLPETLHVTDPNIPYFVHFMPETNGALTEITLTELTYQGPGQMPENLSLSFSIPGEQMGSLPARLEPLDDPNAPGLVFILDQPLPVAQNETYLLSIGIQPPGGAITLSGEGIANESDWDDGVPLRVDSYDGYGGIYPTELVFQMYWDDNPEKLERFLQILDQVDYIAITSNRQWGSLPRLPERFPMTTLYYRSLVGCPAEKSIDWCYSVAEPGLFQGSLGFELEKVFQSDPSIGSFRINDQFAEEAFTVYDHPKVLIFKKSQDYDPQRAKELLANVDFSQVVRVPPLKAGPQPANLMLPSERIAEQRQGGTWSDLFNTGAFVNRSQVLSAVIWYLSVGLLGLIVYPFVRIGLPGLPDRGYPLARTAGLLVLSYLVWLAGSFQIPFTRLTISVVLVLLALGAALLAYKQRSELIQEWRSRRRYFLVVEGLFLAFFLFDLLIRIGNPDLWHPAKGGEKPMDFSYFNAVLKSTTFPPYDPWYAGGYLNYYYYGFIFVGVLVKWLGIVPAVAYNLILPTIFCLIAMGAFSIGWNLLQARRGARDDQEPPLRLESSAQLSLSGEESPGPGIKPYLVGIAAALGMAVLGNLATVRMIFQGYQRLAAPGGVIEGAGLLTGWIWALRGLLLSLTGTPLPYGIGDWYWIPSRAIPPQGDVEVITEFPFFTVLYAAPHAHLFALPIALLAVAFALSVVLGRGRWKNLLGAGIGFLLGGLAIGALRPTNTWDFYPYLALGAVAIGYAVWTNSQPANGLSRFLPFLEDVPDFSRKLLPAAAGMLLLAGLSYLLYQPFMQWYGQAYGKLDLWKGSTTPTGSYLTHWGLFLFLIVSWMAWETREWLASTPLSSLRKLAPYRGFIQAGLLLLVIAIAALLYIQVYVAWLVMILAAWAGILILRPGMPDTKRFVLFLTGTGLVLTLVVEVFVLLGDIGRMNTVFKLYLQTWTLFAVSAAGALGWLLAPILEWLPGWRNAWRLAFAALVFGAALYPLLAGRAKVEDRMTSPAPHSLDGMAYMQNAQYDWQGPMDLNQDYRAIRWMQENVPGSPVIVEANLRDLYRWGSRFSIYTGLPGVAGWEWHQQQQRALVPGAWVTNRILEIDDFYNTTDLTLARSFLRKYDVRYIVLGQLERNHYPGPGLDKFSAANGALWKEVFREGETVIYEVIAS